MGQLELEDTSGDRAVLESRDEDGGYVLMEGMTTSHFMSWKQIIGNFSIPP